MALTTLTKLKLDLGITGTSEDTKLTQFIGQVSFGLRNYLKQYFGGVITSASVAAASVITAPGHNLETGDTIVIKGSNTTPTIDGSRVVTVVDQDTFTIPVTVTVVGTTIPSYNRQYTDYYSGDGSQNLIIQNRPVVSITSVYVDSGANFGQSADPFAAATLLTSTTDYALKRDNGGSSEQSKSGILIRIGSVWPGRTVRHSGLLTSHGADGLGNIKVTYVAGYARLPLDLIMACNQAIAQARLQSPFGGQLMSESLDGYSYNLAGWDPNSLPIGSLKQLASRYKEWVI